MRRFNLLLCLLVALSVLMMVSANPRILAAVITCVPFTTCDRTNGNDSINGTSQNDQMNGLGGKDKMFGNAGDDKMKGGDGADNINGGDGKDSIDEFLDTAKNVISGGRDSDMVRGGNASDTINGDDGHDELLSYGGNDRVSGGTGDDILQGLQANDILEGGDGNDALVGDFDTGSLAFGADTLKGGPGDDRLFQAGGGGNGHLITSDGHKDILDCGDRNDQAWVNVNTDHDETRNCEVVHRD